GGLSERSRRPNATVRHGRHVRVPAEIGPGDQAAGLCGHHARHQAGVRLQAGRGDPRGSVEDEAPGLGQDHRGDPAGGGWPGGAPRRDPRRGRGRRPRDREADRRPGERGRVLLIVCDAGDRRAHRSGAGRYRLLSGGATLAIVDWRSLIWSAGAYLAGTFPSAYLVARAKHATALLSAAGRDSGETDAHILMTKHLGVGWTALAAT